MASIGKTSLTMSLDAAQFNAGLQEAQGSFSKFTGGLLKAAGIGSLGALVTKSISTGLSAASGGGSVSSSFGGFLKNTFGGIAGGAAAGFAVGGPLGGLVGGASGGITAVAGEVGGAVTELADKFRQAKRGATELGISIESFQQLSFAAERAGSSTETFTAAFAKFERSIDEAKSGPSAARDIFNALGISVRDLESTAPDEIFKKAAASIRDLSDPTQRVAATVGLLGRGGAELLPTIINLEAFTAKARDLGIGSSEGNKRLEEYVGSMRTLNDSWTEFKIVVGTAVVPHITLMVEGLTILLRKFKEFADWIGLTAAIKAPAPPTPKPLPDDQAAALASLTGLSTDFIKRSQAPFVPKVANVAGAEGSVAGLAQARQLIGQNPADLFQQEIDALNKARHFGKGAINDDDLAQGVFNAGSKLIRSLGQVSNEIPALFKDSKEATEAIIRSQDPDRGNFADRLLQAIEAQKQIQIQQRDLGREANSALNKLAGVKDKELNQ